MYGMYLDVGTCLSTTNTEGDSTLVDGSAVQSVANTNRDLVTGRKGQQSPINPRITGQIGTY